MRRRVGASGGGATGRRRATLPALLSLWGQCGGRRTGLCRVRLALELLGAPHRVWVVGVHLHHCDSERKAASSDYRGARMHCRDPLRRWAAAAAHPLFERLIVPPTALANSLSLGWINARLDVHSISINQHKGGRCKGPVNGGSAPGTAQTVGTGRGRRCRGRPRENMRGHWDGTKIPGRQRTVWYGVSQENWMQGRAAGPNRQTVVGHAFRRGIGFESSCIATGKWKRQAGGTGCQTGWGAPPCRAGGVRLS